MAVVGCPEFFAGCTSLDPGSRTGSGPTRGIPFGARGVVRDLEGQAGLHAVSRTSYGLRSSMWDSMRDPSHALSSVASLIEGPHPDEVTAPGLNPVL